MANKPQYVIVHTAGAATEDGDVVHQSAEIIRQYHLSKGWRDIGYHYYIEESGEIRKGRDEDQSGAHCRDMGMNSMSIGICCSGHGDYEDFNEAQYASLIKLIRDVCQRHQILFENVRGHRETGARKTCPGNKVDMLKLRTRLVSSPSVDSIDMDATYVVPLEPVNTYQLRLPTGQEVKVTLEIVNG